MTVKQGIENGLMEQSLELCDFCGVTGINPTDKSYACGKCKGMKIVNHLQIQLDIKIPYTCEADRIESEKQICIDLHNMFENMHV